MKTYKIFYDSKQNRTLIAHSNNICTHKVKEFAPVHHKKSNVSYNKTDLSTLAIELEKQGYIRTKNEVETMTTNEKILASGRL